MFDEELISAPSCPLQANIFRTEVSVVRSKTINKYPIQSKFEIRPLHIEKVCELYKRRGVLEMLKIRTLRWARYVASRGKTRNV